jgi:hypothetical protein
VVATSSTTISISVVGFDGTTGRLPGGAAPSKKAEPGYPWPLLANFRVRRGVRGGYPDAEGRVSP